MFNIYEWLGGNPSKYKLGLIRQYIDGFYKCSKVTLDMYQPDFNLIKLDVHCKVNYHLIIHSSGHITKSYSLAGLKDFDLDKHLKGIVRNDVIDSILS